MSVKVNLKALPPRLLDGLLKTSDPQRHLRPSENVVSPFSFPKSKVALWDSAPTGDAVSLHLSYYRNPKLILAEKALRLAYRQARQSNASIFSCFLLGVLTVDDDEEGVTLTLDRFDPGREQQGSSAKVPTALLPGDFLLPCTIGTQEATSPDVVLSSAEDLNVTFKMLHHCCCSREPMELSSLLVLRAHLGCSEHLDSLTVSLHWAAIIVGDILLAAPVRPVPIIPTALARNLGGVASMTRPLHSACRKQGFLSMDQTRKLLLVLESDPKAYSLPLVGVWLSGVTHIHHPQVWAWCLRYLYSSSLQHRVMSEAGAFLVVLYSLTHRDPEFYQCHPHDHLQDMTFQLLTSTGSITLYKHTEVSGRPLQFELSPESLNQETEFFKTVASCMSFSRSTGATSSGSPRNKFSISDHDSGVEDEDLSPRPSPNPHPLSQQTRNIHPSVPELSLIMDGSFLDGRTLPPKGSPPPLGHVLLPAPQQQGSPTTNSVHLKLPGQVADFSGHPQIRRPPALGTLPSKAPQGHSGPGQQKLQGTAGRKSTSSTGRSSWGGCLPSPAISTSSSSTPSTPKGSCSPNTSTNQPQQQAAPLAAPHKPLSPITPHPPSGYHSLRCRSASPSQAPMYLHQFKNLHSTPSLNPSSDGLGCSCCAHQHGHASLTNTGSWQVMPSSPAVPHLSSGSAGVACCPMPDSDPRHECCSSSPHGLCSQLSLHHSPTCITGSPVQCLSPREVTSPPTRWFVDQVVPTFQAPCCQAAHPADTYKILMDQDRQLKLLHAQIMKLLEAQSKDVSPAAPHSQPPQSSSEGEDNTAPRVKECVSVAVSTGASLFWNSTQEQTLLGPKAASANTGTSLEGEKAASLLSDGVDQEERRPELPDVASQKSPLFVGLQVFQSPVLGETASTLSQSPVKLGSPSQEPSVTEDEQRFYKVLQGQVNSRLQASEGVEKELTEPADQPRPPSERWSMSPKEVVPPRSTKLESREKGSRPKQPAHDQVLQATLRQLQKLGVDLELDSALQPRATRSTLESASTLASINPEAVVPRLTLSDSVGTSMWGPGGSVDLSLEANAIALKYLSDSHLSRFSLGMRPPVPLQSPGALLSGNALLECNSTSLGVVGSSNMSFATKKYMKKYGLIEEDSGEEEVDDEAERTAQCRDSALGRSAQTNLSESFNPEQSGVGKILKSITNSQASPPVDSQSQLLRDLRPKMQLLNKSAKKKPQKENNAQVAAKGRRPSWAGSQTPLGPPTAEGSVGNFLDLSRLRQLPKLF